MAPQSGANKESVLFKKLWIEIIQKDTEEDSAKSRESSEHLLVGCDRLGKMMLREQGPWGFGIFDSFQCTTRDPGKKAVIVKDFDWKIKIFKNRSVWTYQMEQEKTKSEKVGYGFEFSIETSDKTTLIFATDLIYTASVAMAILDQMPAVALLSSKGNLPQSDSKILTSGEEKKILESEMVSLKPKSLESYTLRQFQGDLFWYTQRRGPAVASKELHKVTDSQTALKYWQLKSPQQSEDIIWGHTPQGPGGRKEALLMFAHHRHKRLLAKLTNAAQYGGIGLDKIGRTSIDLLKNSVIDTTAAGYVGVRYGTELVAPGESVLPPSKLIGVLLELRGGPLKGVQFSYDQIPKATKSVASETLYVAYKRAIFSYNFSLQFSCYEWMGRCSVSGAPRLGVWSVDARLPVTSENGAESVLPLQTSNTLAYGYDVGLVFDRLEGFLRPWHARDFSLPALSALSKTSVTSTRFGLDGFLYGPQLSKSLRLSFLAFTSLDLFAIEGTYATDSLSLTNFAAGLVQASPEQKPFVISLMSTFAGLGVSLSW